MSTAVSPGSRGTTSPPEASSAEPDISALTGRASSGSGAAPKLTRYSGRPSRSQALLASACMPSNPISSLADESPRWYSSSGAISSGLSGSTTIPALSAPK